MITNDQIIIDELLKQKRQEVAPHFSENEYFNLFVNEQILKDYDLSYDEILNGIVDGGLDGGIDGIYILLNGELIQDDEFPTKSKKNITIHLNIIQAKNTSGFTEKAIEKLIMSLNELLDLSTNLDEYKSVYNSELIEIIKRFRLIYTRYMSRFPSLKISFFYATKGIEVHPNTERKVHTLKQSIHKLFSDSQFEFDFLGAKELLQLARRKSVTVYNIPVVENPISTGKEGFISLINLKEYYNFITDSEKKKLCKKLFEANVRDYQGSIEVNKSIKETLENPQSEDFWWLNNGITIIATKSIYSGKILTIEDPQIVNGLQTSTEIYNYFSKHSKQVEDRNILIRVIVPTDDTSRDMIIKATNSQTKIPPASLRATDKIQRDIEDYFITKNLYYDRRKNYYKNEGISIDKIVSIPYLAQAVMAIILKQPHNSRSRPSSLLKDDENYRKVFDENYPIKLYLVCYQLMKRVEYYLKNEVNVSISHINNIKFHIAMIASIKKTGIINFKLKDFINIDFERVHKSFLDECKEIVWTIYKELGENDKTAKRKEFTDKLLEKIETELIISYKPLTLSLNETNE